MGGRMLGGSGAHLHDMTNKTRAHTHTRTVTHAQNNTKNAARNHIIQGHAGILLSFICDRNSILPLVSWLDDYAVEKKRSNVNKIYATQQK